MHQAFDTVLGDDAIIDVCHQVADTIEDHQVGLVLAHSGFQHRQTLVIAFGPDVEDVEDIHRELILCKTCHGDDTVAKDILRRFLALFGIIPEDVQPFRLDPLDGEHLTAVAEGHQDGRDKRLAALGFAAQTNDFTSWETGFMEHLEEKVHLLQLLVGSDAMGL